MARIATGWEYEVMPKVRALDEDRKTDILQEIVSELLTEKSSDSERIKAIVECFDFVLDKPKK